MATLNISERQTGDVTVFDLNGDVTFGEGNVALRNIVRKAINEGKINILLNFENVSHLDSSGIGELVSGFIALNRANGKLNLLNLSPRHEELLTITRLLTIFETFKDEKTALSDYERGSSQI